MKTKTYSVTYNESERTLLSNMFNDYTCKRCDWIDELRKLGNHSRANEIQDEIDALDKVAKQLGLI